MKINMDDLIKVEYKKLVEEINKHNQLYYNNATQVISDKEYDELMDRLILLEKEYPELVSSESPTQVVGADIAESSGRSLITHNPKMMSISNCYDEDGIQKFVKRCESLAGQELSYMTEMKIDGLAISLIYEDGKLVRGATRGNGFVGEDVTAILKYVSLPKELKLDNKLPGSGGLFAGENSADLSLPSRFEVRGEIYMPREAFKKIVKLQEDADDERVFANPRNAAAGALKTKILSKAALNKKTISEIQKYNDKIEQIKLSNLSLWVYSTPTPDAIGAQSQEEALSKLGELGFPVNPLRKVCRSFAELVARKNELEILRHDLAYDTDGVVIKVNDIKTQLELGEDAKSPNWAVAFKFEPEQEMTTIQDIRIQVGKFGTLTPVADLEPVFVSGSTVSHATLHNLDNIIQKDIRIGDKVMIEKAGEIIPQVAKSLHELRTGKEKEFVMPSSCPVCGSEVAKADGKVSYYCQNISCPAQLRARLLHFVSRETMDIEGFGPAVIDALIERGKLHNVADLYSLTFEDIRELWEETERKKLIGNLTKKNFFDTSSDLQNKTLFELREAWSKELILSGRKEYVPPEYKNAENIMQALEESKSRGLEKLLVALAIEQLGGTAARIIAAHFGSLEKLYTATVSDISNLSAGETFSYRTLGKKSAALLYRMIQTEKAKEVLLKQGQTLSRKIEHLALSGFGEKKRSAVSETFGGDAVRLLGASEAEIANVELGTSDVKRTLGDVVAKSLVDFLKSDSNKEILNKLVSAGVSTEDNSNFKSVQSGVVGKSFVITGTLEDMSRSEAKKIIENAGGRVSSAVSKSTDYLVAGEKAGSKLEKAEKLGVTVIGKDELLSLCDALS